METAWKDLLGQGPLVAVLTLFLYGFWRGWWVFGREVKETKDRCTEWQTKAERATELAEKSVASAEKGIQPHQRATIEDMIDELRRMKEQS